MTRLAEYRVVVSGEPAPWCVWKRPANPAHRHSPPANFQRLREYQEAIREAVRKEAVPVLKGAVSLSFEFYRGLPPGVFVGLMDPEVDAWETKHILQKPDLTNYQKAAEDALRGLVFRDDAQVISVQASKGYLPTRTGCTIITIQGRPAEQ